MPGGRRRRHGPNTRTQRVCVFRLGLSIINGERDEREIFDVMFFFSFFFAPNKIFAQKKQKGGGGGGGLFFLCSYLCV